MIPILVLSLWVIRKIYAFALKLLFGRRSGKPQGEMKTDDGRYDYELSQPVYKIKFEKGIKIVVRDGIRLTGDLFRPDAPGKFPVIMAEAPYPRYMQIQPGLVDSGGVGTKYQLFEQANPEYWVRRGYAYLTFSPRGYSGSEGNPEILNLQEAEDFYDAIEWAAQQTWSNGNIGLYGISYYAVSQYWVASLQPPHLKAIIPWEGLADPYRDILYRGGITSWFGRVFCWMLHSLANNPFISPDYIQLTRIHHLHSELWEGFQNPMPENIQVPMLSVGGLNDPDLHLRGNINMYIAAGSLHKKLLLYSGTHWGSAYQPWANRICLRFFDHWLKGIDTGLQQEPPIDIQLRTGADSFTHLYSSSWPLKETVWTKLYLSADEKKLFSDNPSTESSSALEWKKEHGVSIGEQITFYSNTLTEDLQIAGPISAQVWASSSAKDLDLIVEIRDFAPDGKETRFAYVLHNAPDEPVSRGWIKASHRDLDPTRSKPYQPHLLHTRNNWLTPHEPVALNIEIWPTATVFKAGHRIAFTIHKGPYKRYGDVTGWKKNGGLKFLPFTIHQSLSPKSQKNTTATIFTGGKKYPSWIMLPVIPPDTCNVKKVFIDKNGFSPSAIHAQTGEKISWENTDSEYHTVIESSGLRLWDSQIIRGKRSQNPETWWTTIPWAGTYHYEDKISGFKGCIEVSGRIDVSDHTITIDLGTHLPPENIFFEVQIMYENTSWKTIADNLQSTKTEHTLSESGRYAVRSRLSKKQNGQLIFGEWSPAQKFTIDSTKK